ncbi:hypothetical protein, partial [Acidiphilium sp.]|uniref:hypothetical protein n=1 Tax=Acidiphilium sp. TaxID=527 RepID=UPI003CFF45BB
DIILFMRPDLMYLDPVNAAHDIFPLLRNQVDIVVPAWQSWGGTNDRFAFCTAAAAEIYATRFDGIIEACLAMNGIHSESYLHAIITESGLRIGFTNLRAARVRANGTVADFDRGMLEQGLMDTIASPLAANSTVLRPSC